MFEKPGRFLTLTLVMIVAACASMYVPDHPFRLGLDLRGGTRLVYRFDFEEALAQGKISKQEYDNPEQLLRDTAEILRNRIDPQGVLEASLRPEGKDKLVIELPGDEFSRVQASGPLTEAITAGAAALKLGASEEELANFPQTGGVVGIDDETIRYDRREGPELLGLLRGEMNTQPAAHEAESEVRLLSDDAIRILIENTGDMQFYIGARDSDYRTKGTDATVERQKVDAWVKAHPDGDLEDFNRLPADQGGPMEGLRWFPMKVAKNQPVPPLDQRRIEPLIVQPDEWHFSGDDLETVGVGQDQLGYPAVRFEMKAQKRNAFGDFTEQHVNDAMAIVLNNEIVTLANIKSKLPGGGIIEGGAKGFTPEEVKDMVTVLRSGSLRIRPDLQHEERVGATLGDDYVRRGVLSSIVALLAVVFFMWAYYRRLGFYSGLSLALNLLLLMGVMAFLRATLTLPGIAGLVLTVGMAVDCNVLIYERIREERERGLKLAQATKNGFDRAFVTIFDTNVTTLLTAIVLYNFGTGPVKGFATTLIIGILSTLFSVLVGTKLLVHAALERGAQDFGMARLITKTKIRFMSLSRVAFPVSMVLILASLAIFIWRPEREKLGIDFLGGFTLTARTQEPQPVDEIRSRVRAIGGTIGDSADVKAVLGSGSEQTGYTNFRITFKLAGGAEDAAEAQSAQESGEREVIDALKGILLEEPVRVQVGADGTSVTGTLAFDDGHPADQVKNVLTASGLTDVDVKADPDRAGTYTFTAGLDASAGTSEHMLQGRIANAFRGQKDSSGTAFALAQPIPETSIVGSSVSGELRDKAVQAVLLSLFVTVMYIRVRFKEYAYGFAIVAALVHDVLMTLGALTLVNWLGLLEGEISLAMVAALLTIIGWSQNDTIVIFDRVRENLPRVKASLWDIIDLSINQTLSRTLLTSGTTLIAVVVLFAFNLGTRNVLESFTFAMLVGIITGTYSTIFIACPILYWLEGRSSKRPKERGASAAQQAA
jgi:SecD/SecF fusion protein